MAQFVVTIPDASLARVVDAFASSYGYVSTIDGAPNPENKAQFAQRIVREYVAQVVVGVEVAKSAEAAKAKAESDAKGNLSIT